MPAQADSHGTQQTPEACTPPGLINANPERLYAYNVSPDELVTALTATNTIISQNYQQQLGEAVRIGIAFKGDLLRLATQAERLQLDLSRSG
jgi:hypothetical protein